MDDASNREDWKQVAEALAKETDSKKVVQLSEELCKALEVADGKQARNSRLQSRW